MSFITVMGWNVENFGMTKYKKANGGPELVALIAEVITQNKIDVVGFCEIRSNLGDDIGKDLVAKLGGAGAGWTHLPSPAFGKGRWEQYLFVWNTKKVKKYQEFQHSFPNINAPPPNLGFPRQIKLDRPPFLAFFETVDLPKKQILVAIMHSPAPSWPVGARDAARNIAKAKAITDEGNTCIILGDFNVKESVDAKKQGTPGYAAFHDLVKAGFEQKLTANVLSSLIPKNKAWIGMNEDDCKSAPYDQLFCRTANGIAFHEEGVEDLIVESVPLGTPNVLNQGRSYLGTFLAKLHGKNNGGSPPAAYNTVEDAFEAFRVFVSDHLPVVVEVHH